MNSQSPIVLNVGQCGPDTASLRGFFTSNFSVEFVSTDLWADTQSALNERAEDVRLILVNRKLDADYSDGMEIIRQLKANERFAGIPVMLVSNYPEWQAKAVELGAVTGFGKAELSRPETLARVAAVLE